MTFTQERLRSLLRYNEDTGEWVWLAKPSPLSRVVVGQRAGSVCGGNRINLCLDGKRYPAHRLAWFYVHGKWPINEIDHINGNPSDNRISNLREATRSENARNIGLRADNAAGLKRVGYDKRRNKYRARIVLEGKEIWLGYHDTAEAAHEAYCAAALRLHGEFRNTGVEPQDVNRIRPA